MRGARNRWIGRDPLEQAQHTIRGLKGELQPIRAELKEARERAAFFKKSVRIYRRAWDVKTKGQDDEFLRAVSGMDEVDFAIWQADLSDDS
jgi:hypothetical protein